MAVDLLHRLRHRQRAQLHPAGHRQPSASTSTGRVFCSGIGCSSRLPGYIEADGLHTTHGRAIAFATGVKLAKPELSVIVFTGDGDMAGIGGNHFIHAARRNVDLTVICINNYNYGMTGGQVSPTTPAEARSTTTPYGNLEEPFDLCRLAIGAGAPFVARWTMGFPYETIAAIEAAIRKPGFAFVELLMPCPTGYGKDNELRDAEANWEWYAKTRSPAPTSPGSVRRSARPTARSSSAPCGRPTSPSTRRAGRSLSKELRARPGAERRQGAGWLPPAFPLDTNPQRDSLSNVSSKWKLGFTPSMSRSCGEAPIWRLPIAPTIGRRHSPPLVSWAEISGRAGGSSPAAPNCSST